jgi:glycosyltransferase involved in cell wall biosynthesis
MRVLVMTVVHHPEDARILHRQIASLTAAGHQVVYAAPFSARGVTPRGVEGIDLPRSAGRHRGKAVKAARATYRRLRDDVDITVLHDPELLLAVAGNHGRRPVVWDVHEDTAAALGMKAWMPKPLRRPFVAAVKAAEAGAERGVHLLLAEHGYTGRFRRPHPVVPNQTLVPAAVPPPGTDRVVYLGAITLARGAAEMVAVARLLAPEGIRVELIGSADAASEPLLEKAAADGALDWAGFTPNDVALARLPGALAGLSLLHDEPNYRHSMPTKVIEYMAHGLPVVTTPNPPAAELVTRHRCGTVVPWNDPKAAAQAVLALRDDETTRTEYGWRGHAAALAEHDWRASGEQFVAQLQEWAGR